jgi:alkanesulfonate monooxygenase
VPVEFLGIAATNDGSEIAARSGLSFDEDYTLRLARAHEENGWDRVLFAYGSGAPDPNAAAAYIASQTRTLQLLLAHRPNVSYPTFAAKTFATIDQISDGRVTVHFITGGTDHEQQREGDYSRCHGPGSRSAARPRPRTGSAGPRPISTACGVSRWRAPRSRSSR